MTHIDNVDDPTVLLAGADGPIPAHEVIPDVTPQRALIVVQEAFGVNDHIVDVSRRFAAEGYRVIAPHLFHRDGVNALPYDFDAARPHMANLTAEGIRADLSAARAHLTAAGFAASSIGVVGFCMGGSVALVAASEYPFGAAVTFYGGGISEGRFGFRPLAVLAPELQSPWLGLYGDLDGSISVDEVERLRSAAATAKTPTSVVRYAQAGHAFHCSARPAHYHGPSAADAWVRTTDWFARYLQPAT
jgi:carboxymethylenebutenolidase